jgi:hypothetical protein
LKREREKEIAELDVGNIIETTDNSKRITRNRTASMPKQHQSFKKNKETDDDESDSESENKTGKKAYNFSKIRDLCESSASDKEKEEEEKDEDKIALKKDRRADESLESPSKSGSETKKKVTAKIESDEE